MRPELAERYPLYDFHDFHRRELPLWLREGRGELAMRDRAPVGSLAFRLPDGAAYSYVPTAEGVEVLEGDADADTVIELEREVWSGLVHDLESAPGLLYESRCQVTRGDPMRFVRWEPKLRAIYQGRPIFEPTALALRDRHGAPLDPQQHFALDADREDMAHFLREAGFVVVANVFDAAEVAEFLAESERLRAAAREGDQQSWWGRDSDGVSRLCRVINAAQQPSLGALYEDERVRSLLGLSDHDLVGRQREDYEAVSILWKLPNMSEGLSDLPWHRDCGMGGHAVMCPVLIMTLNLRPGTPETGELRALPGSQGCSFPFFEASDSRAPRGVGLRVEAGDVSLHYGDLMHAAPAPLSTAADGVYRASVLLAFTPRGSVAHHRGGAAYNEALFGREDGQIEHLAQVAERSRPRD